MIGFSLTAQILKPVTWKFTAEAVSDKVYEVHLTATIDEGWHVYSQYTPKGGPFPTLVTFTESPSYRLERKTKEVGVMERKWAEVFEIGTLFYKKKVDFVQRVEVTSARPAIVSGTVEFMVCTDEQCLPPEEVPFTVELN